MIKIAASPIIVDYTLGGTTLWSLDAMHRCFNVRIAIRIVVKYRDSSMHRRIVTPLSNTVFINGSLCFNSLSIHQYRLCMFISKLNWVYPVFRKMSKYDLNFPEKLSACVLPRFSKGKGVNLKTFSMWLSMIKRH